MGLMPSNDRATVDSSPLGGKNDSGISTSNETDPITVVFGTCRYAPRWVTEAYNMTAEAIMSGGKMKVQTGYNYRADLISILGVGPFQKIRQVYASSELVWDVGLTNASPSLKFSNFALGKGMGSCFLQWGNPRQGMIKDMLTAATRVQTNGYYWADGRNPVFPNHKGAYPNQGVLAFLQLFFGRSSSAPNVEVVATRLPMMGLYPDCEIGDGSANPARIIQELRMSPIFGEGLGNDFDPAELTRMAQVFKNEEFGLNVLLDSREDAEKLYAEILGYFGGSVCRSLSTGMLEIKDYFMPPSPEVDRGRLFIHKTIDRNLVVSLSFEQEESPPVSGTQLVFRDSSQDFKEQDVWHFGAMSSINESRTGDITVVQRPWVGDQRTAMRLCVTAGNLAETPMIKAKMVVLDEAVAMLDVGDWVYIPRDLSRDEYFTAGNTTDGAARSKNYSSRVVLARVVHMSKDLPDSGEWELELELDNISNTSMIGADFDEYYPEFSRTFEPVPFDFEVPYELPRPLTVDKSLRVASLVGKNHNRQVGYEVHISTDAGVTWRSKGLFEVFAVPVAVGPNGIDSSDSDFSVIVAGLSTGDVESVPEEAAQEDRLLLILNNEIISLKGLETGNAFGTYEEIIEGVPTEVTPLTYTFSGALRGRIDTSANNHLKGDVGFIVKREWLEACSWVDDSLSDGVQVRVRHSPVYATGAVLDRSEAVERMLTVQERYIRPVPPINVQADPAEIEEEPTTITWTPQNWSNKGYPFYDQSGVLIQHSIDIVASSTVQYTTPPLTSVSSFILSWELFEQVFGTNPALWPSEIDVRVYSLVDGMRSFTYASTTVEIVSP